MPVWALAFSTALFLTLVATPLVRRLALATDLVDKPGEHKTHHTPTPYRGGVAVVVGALAGLTLDWRLSTRVATIAFFAAVLATIGLIDDDRTVDPRYRFVAQFTAAVAAAALGLRVHVTGVTLVDLALTILWIVGVTNAFNLLDNMDGLTAGVAAVAATAIFWLAILAQQPMLATIAAALVGSCLGFLAYNRPPASIFLGDAGSLFVGFVIAILTIDVTPALAPPFGFVIPLMILGLPVLDTTTVTLARLRRGRSVLVGGRDHLSHRLVRRGFSRSNAVLVLVGAEALLAVLAVLGGRRVIQVRWVALGAIVVLAALALATARPEVYSEPVRGFPRRLKLVCGGALVLTALLTIPTLVAVLQADGPTRSGNAAIKRALDGLGGGDPTATSADFQLAGREFSRAHAALRQPLVSLGLIVPGVSTNLQASRTLVSVGQRLSETGVRLAPAAEGNGLRFAQGRLPIQELRGLAADLSAGAVVLRTSRARLAAIDRPFLLPPLQRALRELDGRVGREAADMELASRGAELLPAMFGAPGSRRYFVAFQNSAEPRGTGGLIESWGELVAENGRLQPGRFGTLQELEDVHRQSRVLHMPEEFTQRWIDFQPERWHHVNVSPDFPTTARVIRDLYPQSGGRSVDGVIAVDSVGLSALLELTGPVNVANWPSPIDAGNVIDVVVKETYDSFGAAQERQRIEFLRDLSLEVVRAFTTVDLGPPRQVVTSLGRAVAAKHFMANLNDPEEQRLVETVGADGALPPVQGDSLMVVQQEVSSGAVGPDRRHMRYDVQLDPSRGPASLSGRLEVTLDNHTARLVPEESAGPPTEKVTAGEVRTHLSVYTPFREGLSTLDGRPIELTSGRELGRQVHWTTVTVPASSSRAMTVEVQGQVRLAPDGWYRLDVIHQPSLDPDDIEVRVTVPRGWTITEARGADPVGGRAAEARLSVANQSTVWVRAERASAWARVWDRLRA